MRLNFRTVTLLDLTIEPDTENGSLPLESAVGLRPGGAGFSCSAFSGSCIGRLHNYPCQKHTSRKRNVPFR